MAVHVTVDDDAVDVRFSGLDVLLTLSHGIRLPLAEVTGARLGPRGELLRELGIRVGGGYWPGALATGRFTWKGRKGLRQLWCVYRDQEVLVIDTTRDDPGRVVLQLPDRADQAWYVNERLARRRGRDAS
jgi:hypothetical protein